MIYRLARHTPTSQTFWGCDDTDTGGVLGVVVDGSQYTGDTLAAADNYCGLVTVDNLASGVHTYQMALDGVLQDVQHEFTTAPQSGEDVDLILTGDCLEANPSFANLVANESADAFYASEWTYIDGGEYEAAPCGAASLVTLRATYDERGATADPDYSAFLDSYRIKQRCTLSNPANKWRREFIKRFPTRLFWNNHEFYSLIALPWNPAPGENQFDAAYKAASEYEFMGNPINTDSDLDSVPSTVVYTRETIGDVEIISTDGTSYNDDALANLLDGQALGRGEGKQFAWIKDRIAASTAKFLIIFHTTSIPDNTEWNHATTGILKALEDKDQTAIIIGANIHRAHARQINLNMPTRPIMEFGASPLRQESNSAVAALSGDVVYFEDSVATTFTGVYEPGAREKAAWCYAKVSIRPNGSDDYVDSHMKVEIKNALTSAVRWSCIIPEGSREPNIRANAAVI